jgi:hypothetical protein
MALRVGPADGAVDRGEADGATVDRAAAGAADGATVDRDGADVAPAEAGG